MRVLSVSGQKPEATGSGVYLAQTVRALAAAGHACAVVCGVNRGDKAVVAGADAVFPVEFDTSELPFFVCGMSDTMPYPATRYRDLTLEMTQAYARAFARTVEEAVERFEPDLVVCHHLYLACAITAERMRAVRPSARVVGVCHSTELRQMGSHSLARARIIRAVRGLDAVFALHEAQKSEIEAVFGVSPEQVFVVGTGFDASLFHDRVPGPPTRVHGAAHDGRIGIVYVGKIWEKKGVLSLIRSLSLLSTPAERVVLRCAGAANDSNEVARARALAASSPVAVEFTGQLPPERLADLYRASAVFVLPSFFEGLPLVAVEAIACGCRAVLTDLPGIRPWLDEALPHAGAAFVEPPRMHGVDEPIADELPAFERRLAGALDDQIQVARVSGRVQADVSNVTWEALAARLLSVACR